VKCKAIFLLLLCWPCLVFAQTENHSVKNPSHLHIGAGVFDIGRRHRRHFQYLFEYRREIDFYHIRPLIALGGTFKGSTLLSAGAGYDIFLGKYFVLTPSFAPGLYFKGDGRDLGCVLEFRSSIEISFIFKNKARLGAQYYHVSNASLGYKNPGEESLIIFYAFPLN
jgi:lipid A 3-O-deacylase